MTCSKVPRTQRYSALKKYFVSVLTIFILSDTEEALEVDSIIFPAKPQVVQGLLFNFKSHSNIFPVALIHHFIAFHEVFRLTRITLHLTSLTLLSHKGVLSLLRHSASFVVKTCPHNKTYEFAILVLFSSYVFKHVWTLQHRVLSVSNATFQK